MKVLLVGDSPTVNTGFSRCMREVCNELIASSHEVIVMGLGYHGNPHTYPYPIYPCICPYDKSSSYFGEERLPLLVARLNPDLIIILNDPWNIKGYFSHLDAMKEVLDKAKEEAGEEKINFTIPPVIGWIAVDSKNQKAESLNRLEHVVVWTKFGARELTKGGYVGYDSVIPLGVDINVFYPRDRAESRAEIFGDNLPTDAYLIGVIGRNQPRKRLDLTLQYFSEWIRLYDVSDAYLYLHVAPTGERACDIRSLADYYGLKGRLIINEPQVGVGNDESLMPKIYSSLDLHMTQSQAEGFHLPTLEAMACGVPCLVPNHSTFGGGGWCGNTVAKVKCSGTALTAPLNGHPYTIGEIPDKDETIAALQWLYENPKLREAFKFEGLRLAQSMTWDRMAKKFVEVIEEVYHRG